MEDYKFLFKVVLVGNAGVGKTCLVRRFTQGLFPPGQGATIGVDFMIKTVEVDGEKVKVNLEFFKTNNYSLIWEIIFVALISPQICPDFRYIFFIATNLGYSRPRKISFNNTKLLSFCTCFNIGL